MTKIINIVYAIARCILEKLKVKLELQLMHQHQNNAGKVTTWEIQGNPFLKAI